MATLKAVRGTRDLLPPETALWNYVEATARAVFARYGFGEIRTPVFEDTALFARGVGEETDIVSKEMYTWEDRARADSDSAQSLTLRPENTAGVVRAYIEHKLADTGMLQKLFYIGLSSGASDLSVEDIGSSGRLGLRCLVLLGLGLIVRCAMLRFWRCFLPS
jgi:histidyl-tRNA synthetase